MHDEHNLHHHRAKLLGMLTGSQFKLLIGSDPCVISQVCTGADTVYLLSALDLPPSPNDSDLQAFTAGEQPWVSQLTRRIACTSRIRVFPQKRHRMPRVICCYACILSLTLPRTCQTLIHIPLFERTTRPGVSRVVDCCLECGVEGLVFTSSSSVFSFAEQAQGPTEREGDEDVTARAVARAEARVLDARFGAK